MGKSLIITEKPSVAREFARALKQDMKSRDGYMESQDYIITWCVGHLVTMSYPDAYDDALKRWSMDTLPFIPTEYKYEIIDNVKKQFNIVKGLFHRPDVDVIYNAGDSGREGEYIQRLVLQMAGYNKTARLKRIWIDSQTEDEILRGIREAKDSSDYDNLSAAAYLRAKEDYLMGINFSRVLTLKYGYGMKDFLKKDRMVISVGRVMTCVLGMVVKREREIREFVKTPFYRLMAAASTGESSIEGEWRSVEGSCFYQSPLLYKENGFLKEETAQELKNRLKGDEEFPLMGIIDSLEKKKETRNPPLLYNLAELQNDCSRFLKLSPDETLRIVQELYEKKLTTYPRTDARVLSSAVAREITKNLSGLKRIPQISAAVEEILTEGKYKSLSRSRYVNDKQITDHYAIIPTGQGLGSMGSLSYQAGKVYELIVRRFLSIFYPAAIYQKITLIIRLKEEKFFSTTKVLAEEGYLAIARPPMEKKEGEGEEAKTDASFLETIKTLKKGQQVKIASLEIKTGETTPPKRYNSGSIILAMENAGQLIEDEELRAQIKGSGIGTSATRAEILKKLVANQYLSLNKKTQILTPTQVGEMIYEAVGYSIRPLLNPELTASWEKGLTLVSRGEITADEYMKKLNDFVERRTLSVKQQRQGDLLNRYVYVAQFYPQKEAGRGKSKGRNEKKRDS
ncbi:MAG: DNA topoisomerase [Lachnospiraceae bacterium]|nr:DNA topoisomerase [Lachnospiraceae bacterium]MDY5700616.1 DNA topoisomerase [Lachnospiraceae bacterium]